jgi:hypothetical protein
MDDFQSDRVFRIWDWSISHCRLLLRSPRRPDDPSTLNVDVMFSGVFYLELRESLEGLWIGAPSAEDDARMRSRVPPGTHGRYFALRSGGKQYVVGAAHMEVAENDLPPMQSSLWRPTPDEPA